MSAMRHKPGSDTSLSVGVKASAQLARAEAIAGPGTPALAALLDRWRGEAEVLRRRGAIAQADALASCAAELDEALRQHALEELTPVQAAAESGLSASAIRRLIRRRFPGQRTIRRADLPRKGGRGTAADGLPDLAGELLARRRPGAPA